MNIVTEQSEISGIWRAECPDLPGMSPAGVGMTEVEAVAILFLRIRSGCDRIDWWIYIDPNCLIVNGKQWQDPYWLQEYGEPLTPEKNDRAEPTKSAKELLTEAEKKVINLLSEADDLFLGVIKDGSHRCADQQRWDNYISQAAARVYPDEFCLLGDSDNSVEDKES